MTHLRNIFLEDSIETQLAHGVDRLPLLGETPILWPPHAKS